MKEDKITKRIKELQNDRKYTFKLTEDVIDLVYRTAIEDVKNNLISCVKENIKDEIVITSSKELNSRFGSKKPEENELTEAQKIQRVKRNIYLELLTKIESNNDLMDIYVYVKEKCKEYGEPGVETDYRNKRKNKWM